MLMEIDRIQIATPDAAAAAEAWRRLLGAEPESNEPVHALGAKRTTLRLGAGCVEFLEPDGSGPVADALKRNSRPHLFAAGIATPSFEGLVARLRSRNVELAVENGQAFFDAGPVLGVASRMVLSPCESRPSVGSIDFLYEVTLLAPDAAGVASRLADLLALNETNFVPISSDRFGYDGVLTLFDPDSLHRFEIITPTDETKTMGRFFARNGVSYYMCFAEADDIRDIETRAAELGAAVTLDRPEGRDPGLPADQMWIHPPALAGVMLGLSRPSMAWKWSGHPERVQEIP